MVTFFTFRVPDHYIFTTGLQMSIFRANKRGQEGLKRCIRHTSDPLVSEARLKHCVGFLYACILKTLSWRELVKRENITVYCAIF